MCDTVLPLVMKQRGVSEGRGVESSLEEWGAGLPSAETLLFDVKE